MRIAIMEEGRVIDIIEDGSQAVLERTSGAFEVEEDVEVGWEGDNTGEFWPHVISLHKKIFLFQQFHKVEQLALKAAYREATELSSAAMLDPEMDDRTKALIVVLIAKDHFDALDRIEPADPGTQEFLQACALLGVFGEDPEKAALRVAMITAGEMPPETLEDPEP